MQFLGQHDPGIGRADLRSPSAAATGMCGSQPGLGPLLNQPPLELRQW